MKKDGEGRKIRKRKSGGNLKITRKIRNIYRERV